MLKQILWREGGATNRARAGRRLSKAAQCNVPLGVWQMLLRWPQSWSHCPSVSGFTGDDLKPYLHMQSYGQLGSAPVSGVNYGLKGSFDRRRSKGCEHSMKVLILDLI